MKVIKTIAAVVLLAFSSAAAVADDATWTGGEIKKIDTAQSKLTIKHDEIKHLDMPSMTMVFFVPDAKTLEGLKKGDKKQFDFADMNGRLVVKQVK
jgi:Cu/Ag efflux protein CusF